MCVCVCVSGLWSMAWFLGRATCFVSKLSTSLASVTSLRSPLQLLWSQPSVRATWHLQCDQHCLYIPRAKKKRFFLFYYSNKAGRFYTKCYMQIKIVSKVSETWWMFSLMFSVAHFIILCRQRVWIWYVWNSFSFSFLPLTHFVHFHFALCF